MQDNKSISTLHQLAPQLGKLMHSAFQNNLLKRRGNIPNQRLQMQIVGISRNEQAHMGAVLEVLTCVGFEVSIRRKEPVHEWTQSSKTFCAVLNKK